MGANEKLGAAMHGATPLERIKARVPKCSYPDEHKTCSAMTIAHLIAALEAVQKLPDFTDRVNGNPEFIYGWEAAKEEVKERINEALGEQ